ncbi:Cell division protein FtsL [Nitrincola nitratireducens]|uniref:Cell division protein FtsL n=1 Tax=Nitrincola nitratireducens TaxID=1229521 RepID=W9VMH2_9GAMM|nr:Cell division protein FtsL [Nitrincola nitratireducens]
MRLSDIKKKVLSWRRNDEASVEPLIDSGELFRPAVILCVLIIAIVMTALLVIQAAYDYRRLFNDHQVLVHQWDELQVEWGQLLLEQSTWGGHSRIESEAESRIGMRAPEPSDIEIVRDEQ